MRLETVLPGTWYGYRVPGIGYRVVCGCGDGVWALASGLSVWHLCYLRTPNLRKRDMQAQYYKVLSVPGIPGVAQYTGTQGPEPTLP